MSAADWGRLFGLSLLWGASFFFVELAIPSFAPFSLVLARVGVGAALMFWVLRRSKPLAMLAARWRVYAVVGLLGSALPFVCFAWGQRHIDSGLASVFNSLTPLFVFIFAVCLRRERLDVVRGGGILLGFGGVFILLNPNMALSQLLGMGAAFGAALSYGVATTIAWGRLRHYSPAENGLGQMVFAALWLSPLALLERPWEADFSLIPVLAVLALGALSTFWAYLLYYRLLSSSGGVNAMLATLIIPVIAVALGVGLLGEKVGAEFFAGAGMIFAGLIFADKKLRRALANLLALVKPPQK